LFTSGAIATTGETICHAGTPGEIGSTTAASGGDGTITYSWRSSADNYTAAISGAAAATYTPPAGLTSTTTYRRYAQDGTCNTTATASTGSWTVTVQPAPGMVCPANISINTNNDGTGNCSGTASWTHPLEANGACSPISLHMSVDGGTASLVQAGSTQSLSLATGSHTVAYTLTDGGGNSSNCSFTVEVTDNEVPAITCNNRTVTFGGQANQTLTAADLATATDNCGISSLQTSLSMISCNQVGQTLTATLLATDVNGLQSSCVSQVTVTGLGCGWEAQEDGVNCEDGNIANYNPQTQTYTLTSINCHTPIGTHIADGGAFLQRTLCGNSSITALVENLQGGLGWAGLIMRESNAPGAKKVSLTTNRDYNHRREVRSVANAFVSPLYWRGLNRYWLRLLRVNQQIVGYISTNGSNWQQVMVGTVQMNSCIEVGLWAFNSNPIGTMTATFRHVMTTGNMIMNTLQEIPAGIAAEDMEQAMNLSVFPNPSAGDFFLDLTAYREQEVRIRVTDMLGREVYKQTLDAVTEDIHTLTLPVAVQAGYYQLSVESDGQPAQTAKIMVIRK
jgi:hypothetical protein